MTTAPSGSVLHVANGTSTLRLIEAAGIAGHQSLWADPLHDGPVPGHLSDGELVAVRSAFLTGGRQDDDVGDPLNALRQWRAAIAKCAASHEIVLWYEHDVFDQLNLVQVLTWIRAHEPEATVSLISVDAFPGHQNFKGLGELTPDELASLFAPRVRVDAAHFEVAARVWRAFGTESPGALERLRGEPIPALPYLSRALARFLQEYPWTRDGLSRSERRLLHLAASGMVRLREAFPRMHDGEDAYFITDLSLLAMAQTLSATSPPLLALADTEGGPPSIAHGTVVLTDEGRAVLDGARDHVAAHGIDRWLGGVHLRGTHVRWRWDGERDGLIEVPGTVTPTPVT